MMPRRRREGSGAPAVTNSDSTGYGMIAWEMARTWQDFGADKDCGSICYTPSITQRIARKPVNKGLRPTFQV